MALAARAALVGSDQDIEAFLTTGYSDAAAQDERVRVEECQALGGPNMKQAAQAAIAGSVETGARSSTAAGVRRGRWTSASGSPR